MADPERAPGQRSDRQDYDVLVIGSGPAGQSAAICFAKHGRHTAIIEQEHRIGGACVHKGTIPSKSLRESALQIAQLRAHHQVLDFSMREDLEISTLMGKLDRVIGSHVEVNSKQLKKNGVEHIHGRARFLSPNDLEVRMIDGSKLIASAKTIVIATGSRPRHPPGIPIDHESILDSDSLLSMIYLPRSLAILGGGVIACEYASIFAILGVEVTMIDRFDRPLGFVDEEIVGEYLKRFVSFGGRFIGGRGISTVQWDGVSTVHTLLDDGQSIESEKVLVALGRVANVETLGLEAAGLGTDTRGQILVDQVCRTPVEHIYAVGDVIGPPSLASYSMEQGRRAALHALGIELGAPAALTPAGIFTIPEIACSGMSETAAREAHGDVLIGRARFSELARAQIAGSEDGMMKIIADAEGRKILGVHVVGAGATELIHLGQFAMIAEAGVDTFIENIFNFPSLAEAYRVAALEIVGKKSAARISCPA